MKDDAISRQAVLKLLSTMPPEEAMTKAMLIQSVQQMDAAQPEITLESAIDYLHSVGWMQEHDRILTESAQPEIIRCNSCKHWTQTTGKMKGYGLGRCDYLNADLVTCNGFCYWAERRNDG